MRKSLAILGVVAFTTAPAQNFERVEVVKVDSTRSAAELYRTAERWFVDVFKDAQEVIQLRDTASHTLVGKGMAQATFFLTKPAPVTAPWNWSYTVEVQTKDGRYRVRVYDVAFTTGGALVPIGDEPCCLPSCNYVPKSKAEQRIMDNSMPGYISVCEQVRSHVATLIGSLNQSMNEPKDDW